ncbi:MAG TPA: hypothetical protein VFG68_10525 [Fimbriiglobus sp.]|nr:hypothetical protein [Fimbriiglobus sp.]
MRFLVLLATGVAFTPPTLAGGDPPTAEVIAKIAKSQEEALAAFEREITSWQIDYEIKSFGSGGDLLRHAKYTRRHAPGGFALRTEVNVTGKESGGGARDMAWARNKQYSFVLQKAPGSSEWVLEGAKHFEAGMPAKKLSPGVAHLYSFEFFARHLLTNDGRSYADVLRDPKFVVKSCSASPANKDWVRVTGELPSDKTKPPALKGWWDFDPVMGYCCRGLEVAAIYKGPTKAKTSTSISRNDFTVSRRDSGLITLDSYKFKGHEQYLGQTKNEGYGEWTFAYRRGVNVPESEFTLTAFGLPEPFFATPQRSYTWVYLAAGAVVAAVAAGLVGRRYVRRPATS